MFVYLMFVCLKFPIFFVLCVPLFGEIFIEMKVLINAGKDDQMATHNIKLSSFVLIFQSYTHHLKMKICCVGKTYSYEFIQNRTIVATYNMFI